LILATTTVEDFDRFLNIFSTKGAEKRKEHGSKGATVFRDPNEDDRVWVLFDSAASTTRSPQTRIGLRSIARWASPELRGVHAIAGINDLT
jgi:hypothetical protein